MCKFSHYDTGEVAPLPFWVTNRDNGDEDQRDEHGSSTSESEHVDARSVVDWGGSGSDNDITGQGSGSDNDVVGHESKNGSGYAGMDVELGGDDNHGSEDESGDRQHDNNAVTVANGWDWGGPVNAKVVVEAAEKSTMILGAAAGGWGDESMGVVSEDGWNTVSSKKKGKSQIVW